jgi:hypothetical protein
MILSGNTKRRLSAAIVTLYVKRESALCVSRAAAWVDESAERSDQIGGSPATVKLRYHLEYPHHRIPIARRSTRNPEKGGTHAHYR